jgi:hypothetical protein
MYQQGEEWRRDFARGVVTVDPHHRQARIEVK